MARHYKISEVKYLQPKELEKFFKQITDKRDKAMFLTMYRYGLRVSEVSLLEVRDINFGEEQIFIRRVKNGISGTRRLFSDVKRALNAYLKVRQPRGNILFTGKKGGLQPHRISTLFKQYIKKVAPSMSSHCLRHTCAIDALNSGLQVLHVKALLGHRNIQTTMIYLDYSEKHCAQADEVLERSSMNIGGE